MFLAFLPWSDNFSFVTKFEPRNKAKICQNMRSKIYSTHNQRVKFSHKDYRVSKLIPRQGRISSRVDDEEQFSGRRGIGSEEEDVEVDSAWQQRRVMTQEGSVGLHVLPKLRGTKNKWHQFNLKLRSNSFTIW